MKSLFNDETHSEIITRLDSLNKDYEPLWGKMTMGQMCWHCQYPLKLAVNNKENTSKGNWFIKLTWRKNLPTSSQLKATEPKDFKEERSILKSLVNDFNALKERKLWYPDPIFRIFTKEQWDQLSYKHLDHHLTQFGV